jgi:hypothetical protein
MRFKIILKYLLIILFVIFQLSFFKGLGWPWFNINLLLSLAVFLIVYGGLEENLTPIIIGALILDLASSNIFGVAMLAIFLICYSTYLAYIHIFTNQSLFSLLSLGIIAALEYIFILTIFSYFFSWLNLSNYHIVLNAAYWHNLIWQIIFVALSLAIFYWLSNCFKLFKKVKS